MTRLLAMVGLALAFSSAPALAQTKACPDDYTVNTLHGQMGTVDQAIAQFDLAYARKAANEAKNEMRCLPGLADTADIARIARQMGLLAFFDQDESGATVWGILAEHADKALPWPKDVGPDHPYRMLLAEAEAPVVGGPKDKGLAVPKKGAIFMSGQILLEPRAPAEVPQLIQVFDKSQAIIRSYWQDGAAFPDDLLIDVPGPYAPPKWYVPGAGAAVAVAVVKEPKATKEPKVKEPKDKAEKEKVAKEPKEPKEPKEKKDKQKKGIKMPQLVVGISLAAAAGALYGVAYATKQSIPNKDNDDEKASARTTANALVISSGVTGAAAIGVGITALIGSTNGVQFSFRW